MTANTLSSLSADFPEISELDINPLLAGKTGVVALDARILVAPTPAVEPGGNPRFAIRPYPSAWVSRASVSHGEIVLRPIRPADETLYQDFASRLTARDIRFRFFGAMGKPTHRQLARLTQIDYARDMAIVALDQAESALLGVARFVADADHEEAEFAIIVRSDLHGRGIGRALMQHMIDYARRDGLRRLWGLAFDVNHAMGKLALDLGFAVTDDPQDAELQRFVLDLASDTSQSPSDRKHSSEFVAI